MSGLITGIQLSTNRTFGFDAKLLSAPLAAAVHLSA
jgi:hypothetical protein